MRIASRAKNRIKYNPDHTNYTDSDGNYVPSVTTILKVLAKDETLMIWANNLGWKKKSYKKELENAANIGTFAHSFCEYTFTDNEELLKDTKSKMAQLDSESLEKTLNAINSFKIWHNNNCHKIKVLGCELILSCDDFGGTTDLVCKYDGKRMLIDYKTSGSFYMTQFLQLAAYAIMYEKKYGKKIDDVAVLKLDKKNGNEAELLRLSSLPNGDLSYYKFVFKKLVEIYKLHNILSNDWKDYDRLIKNGLLIE